MMKINPQNLADAFPVPPQLEQGIKVFQYPDSLPVKVVLNKIFGRNEINYPLFKVFKYGLFAQIITRSIFGRSALPSILMNPSR